jgi:hypothetical protein
LGERKREGDRRPLHLSERERKRQRERGREREREKEGERVAGMLNL